MTVLSKLAFPCGAQSPPAFSMRLNDLSADSLLLVFRYLPILELLQVPYICRRWNSLHQTACRQRRCLLLLGAGHSSAFILAKKARARLITNDYHRYNLVVERAPSDRPSPATVRFPSQLTSAVMLKSLSALLPNLTSLYISLRGSVTLLPQLVPLLQSKLVRLHLLFDCGYERLANGEIVTGKAYTSLLGALNNRTMPALRVLRLVLLPPYQIDLGGIFPHSILPQLEHLDLHDEWWSFGKEIGWPLHAIGNSQRVQIALRDDATMGSLLQMNSHLDRSFVYLNVSLDSITERGLPILSQFTSRFTALESLRLNLKDVSLNAVAGCLSKLSHLVDLGLCIANQAIPEAGPADGQLAVVPSVRTLTLFFLLPSELSHLSFANYPLSFIFPSVQVLQFAPNITQCTACGYSDQFNSRCIRMAAALLVPGWSHLRTVVLGEPISSNLFGLEVPVYLTPQDLKEFAQQLPVRTETGRSSSSRQSKY